MTTEAWYNFSYFKTTYYNTSIYFDTSRIYYVSERMFNTLQKWFQWFEGQDKEKIQDQQQQSQEMSIKLTDEVIFLFQQWIVYVCREFDEQQSKNQDAEEAGIIDWKVYLSSWAHQEKDKLQESQKYLIIKLCIYYGHYNVRELIGSVYNSYMNDILLREIMDRRTISTSPFHVKSLEWWKKYWKSRDQNFLSEPIENFCRFYSSCLDTMESIHFIVGLWNPLIPEYILNSNPVNNVVVISLQEFSQSIFADTLHRKDIFTFGEEKQKEDVNDNVKGNEDKVIEVEENVVRKDNDDDSMGNQDVNLKKKKEKIDNDDYWKFISTTITTNQKKLPTLDTVAKRADEWSNGLLPYLDRHSTWNNTILAGGFVTQLLCPSEDDQKQVIEDMDMDFWIFNDTSIIIFLQHVEKWWYEHCKETKTIQYSKQRQEGSIINLSFISDNKEKKYRPIQVILLDKKCKTPYYVLHRFDFSHVQWMYQNGTVKGTLMAYLSYFQGISFVNKHLVFQRRINKALVRGYNVAYVYNSTVIITEEEEEKLRTTKKQTQDFSWTLPDNIISTDFNYENNNNITTSLALSLRRIKWKLELLSFTYKNLYTANYKIPNSLFKSDEANSIVLNLPNARVTAYLKRVVDEFSSIRLLFDQPLCKCPVIGSFFKKLFKILTKEEPLNIVEQKEHEWFRTTDTKMIEVPIEHYILWTCEINMMIANENIRTLNLKTIISPTVQILYNNESKKLLFYITSFEIISLPKRSNPLEQPQQQQQQVKRIKKTITSLD